MDRVNNFLYYLILLLMFAFFTFYLHSRYLVIILAVMVIFPVFECICTHIAAKKLTKRLSMDSIWVNKGSEAAVDLIFKNKTVFPIINCSIYFSAENKYYPNDQANMINISIPAMGEYKTSVPITPVYNGLVNIRVEKVEVHDLLNIIKFDDNESSDIFFYVLPNVLDPDAEMTPGELYSEDSIISVKNVNGTQIDGIRDYVMGDKLRNIHWKLSAKKQDLLVKEYSDSNEEAAVLLVELYSPAIDDIMDNVYSAGKMLLENAYPFTVAFASAGSEQLTKLFINEDKAFRDSIEKMYLAYPSENDKTSMYALRREYAGSGIIYIHGGNGNKAVIDII